MQQYNEALEGVKVCFVNLAPKTPRSHVLHSGESTTWSTALAALISLWDRCA